MINYITNNNLQSSTAEQIKAIADADLRTVRDVPAGELQTLLADMDLLLYVGSVWAGKLNEAIPGDALNRLKAHFLQPDRQLVKTTEEDHAKSFWGIAQIASQLVDDPQKLMQQLDQLSGGRAAPQATVEQWQEALEQLQADALVKSIEQRANAAMEAAKTEYRAGRFDQIATAAQAAWEA